MKVFYQGADVTKDVSVAYCWHDMYLNGKSDELLVKFNDTRNLWDGWAPQEGDRIAVEDGAAKTGEMYVESVKPESSLLIVHALAMPPKAAKTRRMKSWEDVRLFQLFTEVADRYGLGFETCGATDRVYKYVEQHSEPDYLFLSRRAAYEGCGLLTYDGKLILYSGEYMDSQSPMGTIKVVPGMDYSFTKQDENRYGSCEVTDGNITGSYTADDRKWFVATIADRISNQAEGDRFAKGLLRHKNKDIRTVKIVTDTFMRSYAAGSAFTLEATAAASWDGPAIVDHLRHDYVRRRSTLWARQRLEGY